MASGVCVAGGCMAGGACMAGEHVCVTGGHAWRGGVCHACPPGRYYEIRSMSGRYASYWNAFLFLRIFIQDAVPTL